MKLNKNQIKFFKQAVDFFGDDSVNIRLKDINEFANNAGLIVPTSALKNYCHTSFQERGYYDLTLSGIKPIKKDKEAKMNDFIGEQSIIIETSVFVK